MFEREISEMDVREVLERGEVIEVRSDDVPYASRLVLGWVEGRAIHVVAMEVPEEKSTVIITVYEPDRGLWSADMRERQ